MADPTKYTRNYSFTGWQSTNPSRPLPALPMDNEFIEIQSSIDEIVDAIKDVRREDGALNNKSVTLESLSTDVLRYLASDATPRGAWATATSYVLGDLVSYKGATYIAVTEHTSGTFTTDLGAGRWMLFSADLTVSPAVYGAVGDGIADDTVPIQAAISAVVLMGGGRIFFPKGVYKITSTITWPANVFFHGDGATIDYTAIPKTYTSGIADADTVALAATGSFGTKINLTANATEKTSTVTVASATGLAAGDWVQVGAEDLYPYSGTFEVKRGEIKKIRTIAGGDISFTSPLYESYTTANTAFIRKVNFVENIGIQGIQFLGSYADQLTTNNREVAIRFEVCKNFYARDCYVRGQDFIGIDCTDSIFGDVEANEITGVFRQSSASKGTVYYGIRLANCSQWNNVRANKGQTLRRLVVNTASQARYGQPYFNTVHENHFFDSHSNSSGRVDGFEHHGFGRWCSYIGNSTDGALGGMRIEGRDLIIANNNFVNSTFAGITFDNEGKIFENILITGNTITRNVVDAFSSFGAGIMFYCPTHTDGMGALVRNVNISGNNISGFSANAFHGVRVVNTAGVTCEDCVIANNSINSLQTTPIIGSHGILVDAPGWQIYNNRISNYVIGLYIDVNANNIVARQNSFMQKTLLSQSGECGIRVEADNCAFAGNFFQNYSTAVRLLGTADATRIDNSTTVNVTAFMVNSGTNTTVRGVDLNVISASTAIVGGVLTPNPTASLIIVDTEGAAATDDLDSINGGYDGRIIVLRSSNAARVVTAKDGTQLRLAGDFIMNGINDTLTLIWNGTQWQEIARSDNNVVNQQQNVPITITGATNTTLDASDSYIYNRAGTVTTTLPAPASFAGRCLRFKTLQAQTVVSASSNVVPIDSATAGTAILPATIGAWALLISDGTNWVIMQRG